MTVETVARCQARWLALVLLVLLVWALPRCPDCGETGAVTVELFACCIVIDGLYPCNMGIPTFGSMVALDKRVASMLGKVLPCYPPLLLS